jgi:hypothetical protein
VRAPAALVAALVLAGCASDAEPLEEPTVPEQTRERSRDSREPHLRLARCPASMVNCEAASGRVLYVERVDPDGDGDAHFVLASRQSITAPGISVIDVRKGLRPSPLPGPGARISAAGPVFEGSYGQRQIQAIRVYVAGRG